jgi:hypothetical protein
VGALLSDATTTPGVAVRMRRWAGRMALRAALILVALGGAFYLALPHLPAWARGPIDGWLHRLPASIGAGSPRQTTP